MVNLPAGTGQGRPGALEALLEVAGEADRKDFGTAIECFEAEDYAQIISLAWRHQFDDDRSKFKRELRELQQHISEKIIARLELSR